MSPCGCGSPSRRKGGTCAGCHRLATNRAMTQRRYGLSFDAWGEMLLEQTGRCAVCLEPLRIPCVDHDHATGAVRALVCHGCNSVVAALESPKRLVAETYLKSHSQERGTP